METDYSHKIQSLIFLRYAELFTNYAFVDHETAIDLMAGEIQTLRAELQQYKEALRLACKEIVELQTGFCKDGEEIDLMNICLTQAKGGS